MNWKKALSILLALAMSLTLLAGCGDDSADATPTPGQGGTTNTETPDDGGGSDAETIKVGVLLPMSGSSSYYGGVQLDGIEFCVDYVNNTLGGIESMGGAKIELVVQDTASTPETGVSAFEVLVEEGVSAVIGPYTSTVGAATAPLAIQHQVPYVLVNCTSENFMNVENKYVYRTNMGSSDNQDMWGIVIDYLNGIRPDNPTDRVAIVYDSGDWGTTTLNSWLDMAPRMGVEVVISEAISESSTDLSTLVNRIKTSDIDMVLVAAFSAGTNLFVRQMSEYEANTPIVGLGGGVGDIEFIANCGEASEDVLYAAPWLPKYGGGSDTANELNEKFAETYGYEMTMEPSWGWLGMATIADALNRAGSADREALADALAATDIWKDDDDPSNDWIMMFSGYEGMHFATEGQYKEVYTGGVRYNNNDRVGEMCGYVLVQVQDGDWTVVYPESYNGDQTTIHY